MHDPLATIADSGESEKRCEKDDVATKPSAKPADLMLAFGVIGAGVGAILGLATLGYSMPRHAAFRDKGLVAEARVKDMETATTGRRRSRRTEYRIEVGFDPKSGRSYADHLAGPPTPPPPVPGAKVDPLAKLNFSFAGKPAGGAGEVTAVIKISHDRFEKLSTGSTVPLAYLPEAPTDAMLFDTLAAYSATPMLGLSFLFMVGGGALAAVGQKKRLVPDGGSPPAAA